MKDIFKGVIIKVVSIIVIAGLIGLEEYFYIIILQIIFWD